MNKSKSYLTYTLRYQSPFRPIFFRKKKQIICKQIIVFFAVVNELFKKHNNKKNHFNLFKTNFLFSKIKKKNIIINRAPYRYKLAKNNLVFMLYHFTIKFKIFLGKPINISDKSTVFLIKTLSQLHLFFKNCDTSIAPLKSVSINWPVNFNNFAEIE